MLDERSSYLETQDIHKTLLQNSGFTAVFDQMPNMALVLDQNRQIVFGNQRLLDELGLKNIQASLSLRPGELLKCIHATAENSCGNANECRYCDALSAVKESHLKKTTITKDARVTVQPSNKKISLDIKVTASPLSINNMTMTMVFFSDISDQKRREYLEEVFLHDTRNTLSALTMQGEILSLKELPEDLEEDLVSIQKYLTMLIDDINGHQLLIHAEKDVLQSQMSIIPVHELISQCLEAVATIALDTKVKILVDLDNAPEYLMTDPRLARRVLVNALKNAIEATPKCGKINIMVSDGKMCTFQINNPGCLDEAVQKQIFQRSFSTKGPGRGLGTYSMRLILETYLGGDISFTSSKDDGTTFFIMFPDYRSD